MSAPQEPRSKDTHPLPLSSTLHDLALLRASDLDFASLLLTSSQQEQTSLGTTSPTASDKCASFSLNDAAVEASVQRSLEFSCEARAVLKLLHTDAVEREGGRVEEVQSRLEDILSGLDA